MGTRKGVERVRGKTLIEDGDKIGRRDMATNNADEK